MAQDRKLLVTFTTLVCLVFAASLSGLPVVPVSGAVVPELVPRSGQQWSIAQTCCAGCSYTSGCCCPKRHPVTTSIRPAPATKTITVTAKKQNARAYYAVDYPEQVSEEAAEDEAEEETLMSVRAAAAAPAAAAADGRHNCALCPAGIVVAPFKKGKTSANYCCPRPQTVTKTLPRRTMTFTKTATSTATSGVTGRLFLDNNGNGVYDVGIDVPVANMIVDLARPTANKQSRAASGVVIAVGSTDANGVLSFPAVTLYPGETLWVTIHDVITKVIAVIHVGQQGTANANMPVNPPGTPCSTAKTSTVTATTTTTSISITTSTVTVQGPGGCQTTSRSQTKSNTKTKSKTQTQQAGTTTGAAAGTTTAAAYSTTLPGTTTVPITTTRVTPATGTPAVVYGNYLTVQGPTVYDALGNSYVGGQFWDWSQMGATNVTVPAQFGSIPAFFINKNSAESNVTWTYYGYAGGNTQDDASILAIDASADGSLLIAMSATADWLYLPPHNITAPLYNASNPSSVPSINVVFKLNPDGTLAWHTVYGKDYNCFGPESAYAVSAPKGSNTHAYLGGSVSNNFIAFGDFNATKSPLVNYVGFLVQLDWNTGAALWLKLVTPQDPNTGGSGSSCRSIVTSLALTSADNLYVGGKFYCNSTFIGISLQQPRPFRNMEWAFLMMVPPSGVVATWSKAWGDNNPMLGDGQPTSSTSTTVESIDLSNDETKLLVGGYLQNNTVTYSDGTPIPLVGIDALIVQGYMLRVASADGALDKVMSVGASYPGGRYGSHGHACWNVKFDPAGNMYCGGDTNDIIEFYSPVAGNFSSTAGNGSAILVMKFDNNGLFVNHLQIEGRVGPTTYSASLKGMAINYLGNLVLTASCSTQGSPLKVNGTDQTYPNGTVIYPPTPDTYFQTILYDV